METKNHSGNAKPNFRAEIAAGLFPDGSTFEASPAHKTRNKMQQNRDNKRGALNSKDNKR